MLTVLCSIELSEMAASSNKMPLDLMRNQVSPSFSSCPKASVFEKNVLCCEHLVYLLLTFLTCDFRLIHFSGPLIFSVRVV